ncbi:hypothetical protein ACFQS3_07160 [Glycomyces mayteni]|uniref:Lycopene cyclase domain-containing protein n=1 Tax=Glycomyces mayteni TaxID=543887 RepID=A0ABW2D775_9ACTN
MHTDTHSSRGALGHRIAWATGPLAAALVAAAVYNGQIAPMDPGLGLILDFAALWAALATSLLTRSRALRLTAQIAAPVLWIVSFYDWFAWAWMGSTLGWTDSFASPIFFALMAMPPFWLLLAVWRRTSTGAGSFLAEAGALTVMAMALFVLTIYLSSAVDPASPAGWLALVFGAAAALVALAAWRRAGRRVAYGFVALLFAAVAAGSPWLFHSEDPDFSPPGIIGVEVFAPGVIAVAAIATALQFAWTAWRKPRTGEPAGA